VLNASGTWQAWREVTFQQGSGEVCKI
jgi:hypothetical protein